MYSWHEDTSDWHGDSDYKYSSSGATKRKAAAKRAAASGPRTYKKNKSKPNLKIIDPKKHISTKSKHPLIVAIDVTGSMSSWPFEIFDRLPLLFNTLSQYRDDLEICFAAIGDARVDTYPLQVTSFASGFDLEQLLGSLYGEGGGGDAPESYGLFAEWVNTHVTIPDDLEEDPFLIVFGDVNMHPETPANLIEELLGDKVNGDSDSIKAWQEVSKKWNTWFLRRPTGKKGDAIDKQWQKALGQNKIFHIEDEQRAIDYTMGMIARSWGNFEDFQENMRARHDDAKVDLLSRVIEIICPKCGGPVPVDAASGMFSCIYCGTTLKIS